jgi:hypothetical protein
MAWHFVSVENDALDDCQGAAPTHIAKYCIKEEKGYVSIISQ